MTPGFVKEYIKFEIEWQRFYFLLFLTDVSGSVALLGKTQPMNTSTDIILVILGVIFACVLVLLIYEKRNRIKNLLSHLNS